MKKLNKFVSIAICTSLAGGMAFAQQAELGRNPQVRLLESAQQSVTKVQFRMDNLRFTEVQTTKGVAQVPTFTEGVNVSEKGMPTLPILSRSLAVSDTREMKVEVVSSKFIEKQNVLIAPSKGMIMRNEDPNKIPYTFGQSYSENKFFPGEVATLSDPFIVREVRGQVVNFAPLQYNPVTKTLRIYTEIVVAVSETAQQGKNTLAKPKGTFAGFEDTYHRLFMNYKANRYTPVEEKQDGRMIVIVPEQFKNEITEFVAWKNQRGLRTEVKVAEEIASPVTAAAVRQFVKDEYNKDGSAPLMYVLLIGDNKHIPAGNGTGGKSDQIFGQVVGTDHYNEVFIGRFSCENVEDLKTQINRTIHYERDVKAGESWLGRGLCIASSDGGSFADNGESDIQHETVIANLLTEYGYTYVSKRFGDGAVTAQHIISDINAGTSIINYTGHGSDTYWVTSGFGTNHMSQLTNYNQLPFIFDVACVNGNFMNMTCFAEGFMRAQKEGKPTGSIAIIASTINQPWNPPMRGQDEMNEILCEKHAANIKRTFGGITTNGIYGMIEKYGASAYATADTWTVFGDPSLLVRTLQPKAMTVTAPSQIALTDASVSISCDYDGAIASISANGKLFGSAIVTGGAATINLQGLTNESSVTLTVVGYNKETVVKTINISGSILLAPVTNLDVSAEGNTVTLKWDAPDFGDSEIPAYYTYTVFRNMTIVAEGLTATTFSESNLPANLYIYCVRVMYPESESMTKCVDIRIINPVTNLTATQDGMNVVLQWMAPDPEGETVLLEEGFESGIPATWTTIDADGDGNNWTTTPEPWGTPLPGHDSSAAVSSASYINGVGPQTPDNYLVTPELNLANGGTLTFWVCAQDAAYAAEHY
ncbi:C25 family peptidase propeptide domain-containing protein, partial [Porphyromonas loveana]|uniref:C25 family peptidase propeptide domain-containing protein n=2 Tax=Porphyromonas loveana TaxID=1884669 RepID=UPI00359F4A14